MRRKTPKTDEKFPYACEKCGSNMMPQTTGGYMCNYCDNYHDENIEGETYYD